MAASVVTSASTGGLRSSRSVQNINEVSRTTSAPNYAQHATGSASTTTMPTSSITSSYLQTAQAAPAFAVQQVPDRSAASSPVAPLTTKPAVIDYGNYRFCVHDAPTDSNLPSYIDYLLRKKTVALVRACEPTYEKAPLVAAGIKVVELPFQDGSPPPDAMIASWLQLVEEVFGPPGEKKPTDKAANGKKERASSAESASASSSSSKSSSPAIAVHCVAGLGRAPVLVCIALIEAGMHWQAAVELVRKKRRGALNITQLQYLEQYKRRKKDSCAIM